MSTAKNDLRRLTSAFAAPCLLPKRQRTLWTISSTVEPALVSKEFGRADLLLGLSPIQHRPLYYLVWVDAQWMEDSTVMDHVDDIYEAIAEEFGSYCEEDGDYEWPMENFSEGSCWWRADTSDILPVAWAAAKPAEPTLPTQGDAK